MMPRLDQSLILTRLADYGLDYNAYGFPTVGQSYLPNLETLAFDRFGTKGPNFHLFVDDWRLETIWRSPSFSLGRVFGSVVTAPDFSVFADDPLPFVTWQVWRSRVVAAVWASAGLQVLPVVQFGGDSTFEHCIQGVAVGSVIAVRGPNRRLDLKHWRRACLFWSDCVQPSAVVQFGRQDGSDVWACPVIAHPLKGGRA